MKLSREEVLHIANLARLDLTEDEIINYGEQLSDILAHFTSLQEVDTSQTEVISATLKDALPFREDQIDPFSARDQLIEIAPQVRQDQFVVPPVFEIQTNPSDPSQTTSKGQRHEKDA